MIPQFYPLDMILVGRHALNILNVEQLRQFYPKNNQTNIEKELMNIDDFNFYLEHVESALEHLLSLGFKEFYK